MRLPTGSAMALLLAAIPVGVGTAATRPEMPEMAAGEAPSGMATAVATTHRAGCGAIHDRSRSVEEIPGACPAAAG